MQTAIFIPPLPRMSGGLAVLMQCGEQLARMGHDVCFVLRESTDALQQALPPHIPRVAWEHTRLSPQHLWLVPEGWAHALAPGLQAGARCVLYVQNWAYVLGSLPEKTRWEHLRVDFIAVSEPVRWFIQHFMGKNAPIVRPALDTHLFYPPPMRAAHPHTISIAWMPRKNKALARQIRECLDARMTRLHPHITLEWREIHGKSRAEVANLLRQSHIFLASGFPEGCPLPPLEAMASGCLVVGFAGFGGWDYMRQALPHPRQPYAQAYTQPHTQASPLSPHTAPWAMQPWWPMAHAPADSADTKGGNAFICADADVPAAALALEHACLLWAHDDATVQSIVAAAVRTAATYGPQQQYAALEHCWRHFTA